MSRTQNGRGDSVLSLVVYSGGSGTGVYRPAAAIPVSTELMQMNLTPDRSLLAIVVIFILNYLVVRKFFFQPINEVLEARARETKSAEQIFEESLARFNEATSRMEEQLHVAKREAGAIRDRFRSEAGAYRADTVNRTQTEARAQVAAATASLDSDVKEAREKIHRDSESLARMAAERILGRAI
jgi:F-type H+-transporting ATPase subunit b